MSCPSSAPRPASKSMAAPALVSPFTARHKVKIISGEMGQRIFCLDIQYRRYIGNLIDERSVNFNPSTVIHTPSTADTVDTAEPMGDKEILALNRYLLISNIKIENFAIDYETYILNTDFCPDFSGRNAKFINIAAFFMLIETVNHNFFCGNGLIFR